MWKLVVVISLQSFDQIYLYSSGLFGIAYDGKSEIVELIRYAPGPGMFYPFLRISSLSLLPNP